MDELRSGVLRIVDVEELSLGRDFSFVHAETDPDALVRQFMGFVNASL